MSIPDAPPRPTVKEIAASLERPASGKTAVGKRVKTSFSKGFNYWACEQIPEYMCSRWGFFGYILSPVTVLLNVLQPKILITAWVLFVFIAMLVRALPTTVLTGDQDSLGNWQYSYKKGIITICVSYYVLMFFFLIFVGYRRCHMLECAA